MDPTPTPQITIENAGPEVFMHIGLLALCVFALAIIWDFRYEILDAARWAWGVGRSLWSALGVSGLLRPQVAMSSAAAPGRLPVGGVESAKIGGVATRSTPPENGVASSQSETPSNTGGVALGLSPEEVLAVNTMIMYRERECLLGRRPNKQLTIETGFGLKKGTNDRYKRASAIYDAFFVPPIVSPFRATAPDGTPIKRVS